MINLYDALLTDLLRNGARYNPEVQSVAYAVLQEKRRIIDHADQTRTIALIDDLPEEILDILAVELRTPAYDEEFPIETKRALIKGTLPYYSRLGTPAAVNWVVATLFGNGKIQEWFDYQGEPHHFRVTVRNDGTFRSLNGLVEFIRLIDAVKRKSSWLDGIIVVTEIGPATLRMGGTICYVTRVPLPEIPGFFTFESAIHTGGSLGATHTVPLPELPDAFTFDSAINTGGTLGATHSWSMPQLPDTFRFEDTIQTGGTMAASSRLNIPEITNAKPMTHTGMVGAQGAVNIIVPLPEIQ